MDHSPRIVTIDWLSRLLAMISLLAVACGVGYVLTRPGQSDDAFAKRVQEIINEQTSDDSGIQEKIDTAISKSKADLHQEFHKEVKAEVETAIKNADVSDMTAAADAIKSFNDKSDKILKAFNEDANKLLNQRDNDLIALHQRMSNKLVGDDDSSKKKDDVKSNSDDSADSTDSILVARVTMRPVDDFERLVRVYNTHEDAASIQEISFKPKERFTKSKADDELPNSLDSVRTIVFYPHHNTGTNGKHYIYNMVLQEPIQVESKQDMHFRFNIRNSEYAKYGFIGSLKFTLDSGKVIEAKNVRVSFEE